MTPEEFMERFIMSIPEQYYKARPGQIEFVQFESDELNSISLSDADRKFLLAVGLPKEAAPFLSFRSYDSEDQKGLAHLIPEGIDCFIIGHNGSGDAIAIDLQNEQVVYFNHDLNLARVFINSNLTRFCESLCVYSEHFNLKKPDGLLSAIQDVDDTVSELEGFWVDEFEIAKEWGS